MSGAEVDVLVDEPAWEALGDVSALASEAIAAARGVIAEPTTGTVSLLFTSDATMAALNAAHRDKDGPTNVLAFPALAGPEPLIGDVALGFQTTAEEAGAQAKALRDHAAHLIVHGYLHLEGFDHQSDDDAEVMEQREIEALARLGVADPYAEGAPAPDDGAARV